MPALSRSEKVAALQRLKRKNDEIESSLDARDFIAGGRYAEFKARYRNDLAGFAVDCFRWEDGDGPAPYQLEIFEALPIHRRVSVRGPHGLGKTFMESIAVLWFALTRDGEDWKCIQTASAWRQLTKYLWPEIHKWSRRLDWEKIGRPPFDLSTELLLQNLNLDTGSASPVASNNHEFIEGAHASQFLFSYDESKAVPDDTWDASEGAFSTGEVYVLAVSTPGDTEGRFYQIHKREPGYEDWWVRYVTKEECIAAGRMNPEWAEQRLLQWGAESSVYRRRVLGQFCPQDESGVIPLAWIEAANERWLAWADGEMSGEFIGVGVDVADEGADESILALRYGNNLILDNLGNPEIMTVAQRLLGIIDKEGGRGTIVVDGIGVGAGLVSRLKELTMRVVSFVAGAKAVKKINGKEVPLLDATKTFGFADRRSAAWWNLREMLDPESGLDVGLPPSDTLTGDLTAPTWGEIPGSKIRVESKKDIRKRLRRSTNEGDAVIQIMDPVAVRAEPGKYRSGSKRRNSRTVGKYRRR